MIVTSSKPLMEPGFVQGQGVVASPQMENDSIPKAMRWLRVSILVATIYWIC